jgi:hypothetical protein
MHVDPPPAYFVPIPTPGAVAWQVEPAVAALDDGGYVIAWFAGFRAGGASRA